MATLQQILERAGKIQSRHGVSGYFHFSNVVALRPHEVIKESNRVTDVVYFADAYYNDDGKFPGKIHLNNGFWFDPVDFDLIEDTAPAQSQHETPDVLVPDGGGPAQQGNCIRMDGGGVAFMPEVTKDGP
jgi:hypothetical protein